MRKRALADQGDIMPPEEITHLLLRLRDGRHEALEELLPIVYDELRAIAHRRLSPGRKELTLNTTALVHEAYFKLFDRTRLSLNDRKHFFSVAAMAMRQIIVDHARQRQAQKRGGDYRRLDLEPDDLPIEDRGLEILSLDEEPVRLTALEERLGRVVELRFFGGLSVEETAEVLDVDPRTVKRDWRKARALLYQDLTGSREP